jgi:hypothetical protein
MNPPRFPRTAAALSCAAILFFSHCALAVSDGPTERAYGKKIVADYQLPVEQIAKFTAFEPSGPVKGESAIISTLTAKTEDWSGPRLDGATSGNPYTIVVTVSGTAKADGPAATLWNAGWAIQSENGDQIRMTVLPGLAKTEAKGGEAFTVTAAATPTSFKEDRAVAVALGLVNARNIEIGSVRVQVWSGMAPTSFLDMLGPARWLLVGVVMLVLWWFWFKR